MIKENLNTNLDQIQKIRSLAGSIAHETRNPLSAIKGCCEVVKDNLTQAIEFIDLISISSNRGLMIIDMILTNIREGEINKDNFTYLSIKNVVKQAVKEYAFESDKQRDLVHIDLKSNFKFKGDETLMIFVLFNLLKNSLYYKAKVDIWLNRTPHYNYLHFQDYGVGIPADKIPYIFDNFFTNRKKGGTGLGLSFCKRVMLSFGGDIKAESKEDEGVLFHLKFPTK